MERLTSTTEDRRRFHRYAVNFRCLVKPPGGSKGPVGPALSGETQNVSSGGLFLVVSADWKMGAEIEFEIHIPLKAFAFRPVVVRCRGKIERIVPREQGRIGVGVTIDNYEFFHTRRNQTANRLESSFSQRRRLAAGQLEASGRRRGLRG